MHFIFKMCTLTEIQTEKEAIFSYLTYDYMVRLKRENTMFACFLFFFLIKCGNSLRRSELIRTPVVISR